MNRPLRYLAIVLLAFGILARVVLPLAAPRALADDPDGYRRLAAGLVQHGTYAWHDQVPTAYRPPLYPWLLTPCVALGPGGFENAVRPAIACLHILLGLATIWLVYRVAKRWGLGDCALLAAALVACDPILLNQSTVVMTETAAALLAALVLWCLALLAERPSAARPSAARAAAAGVAAGLAVLCRPTFLPWVVLVAPCLAWCAQRWSARAKLAGAFLAAAALALSPWIVRNWLELGRPIATTTHGGYTLLLANNPDFYAFLRNRRPGQIWDSASFAWWNWQRQAAGRGTPADELKADRRAYQLAAETIAQEPSVFLDASMMRVGWFWGLVPHQLGPNEGTARRVMRYVTGLWYLGVFVLAGLGLWAALKTTQIFRADPLHTAQNPKILTPDPRPLTPSFLAPILLLLPASFTAVHAVYWTDMRMRGPVMPAVAVLAAAGAMWLAGRTAARNPFNRKKLRPASGR